MLIIFLFVTSASTEEARTRSCDLLIAVDQTVYEGEGAFPENLKTDDELLKKKVQSYVDGLNTIFTASILARPPHHTTYFRLAEVRRLTGFMVGCENGGVILSEFTRVARSQNFCLAHLLTNRDLGCVVGLAYLGTLCNTYSNTGWTKVGGEDSQVVHVMAHELGHNFGSGHDGGDTVQYGSCTGDQAGIMGGGAGNFSTCSLSAMHAKLQEVLRKDTCFRDTLGTEEEEVRMSREDLSGLGAPCPPSPPDPEGCHTDPPQAPEPPPRPVCGNGVVEGVEECDCGQDYLHCPDPCCHPATLSPADIAANSSAKPCTRNTKEICLNPVLLPLKFGLIYPMLVVLLAALLLALVLWLDWRFGKRRLFFHVTEREERRMKHLRVETDEQKQRRLKKQKAKLTT